MTSSTLYQSLTDFIINSCQNACSLLETSLGLELAAIVYILLSSFNFFLMLIFNKQCGKFMSILQLQIFRGLFIGIINYIIMDRKKIDLVPPDHQRSRLTLKRSLLAVQGNVIFFLLIYKIPLSELSIIPMCSPFVIGIMETLKYGTIYSKKETLCGIFNVLGILFIIKPEILLGNLIETQSENLNSNYAQGYERVFYLTIQFSSVLLHCYSVILIKEIKSLNIFTINLPFGFMLSIFSSMAEVLEQKADKFEFVIFIFILFYLVACYINFTGYTRAIQIGRPAKLVILNNLFIVYIYLFEILYLKEEPRITSVIGSVIIVLTSIKLTLLKSL